jgi:hypothetical protein
MPSLRGSAGEFTAIQKTKENNNKAGVHLEIFDIFLPSQFREIKIYIFITRIGPSLPLFYGKST